MGLRTVTTTSHVGNKLLARKKVKLQRGHLTAKAILKGGGGEKLPTARQLVTVGCGEELHQTLVLSLFLSVYVCV